MYKKVLMALGMDKKKKAKATKKKAKPAMKKAKKSMKKK